MSPFHILIADDEEHIRKLIQMYLNKDIAVIDIAEDGETALNKALSKDFDIILLDWMMPGISGLEVCQLLKSMKSTPVIMLSANGNESDRLKGFEAGVDDYVTKPFSPRELLCRVYSILKRTQQVTTTMKRLQADKIILSPLTIDHHAHRVTIDNQELTLTPKEYDLLRFLAIHCGKTFSRKELIREVWGFEAGSDFRTVDSHVKRLRDKFEAVSPAFSNTIKTIWGIGYQFDPTR
ncbi:response regulator transcription factor [Paenibacillus sp. OAS669]|uniref:response regulator transcription factor n=1 Tax=Paenibacillus sp. OAS669 TaxID=2663821 RepID=UPI00178B8EB4|nr:response regulator transcription factor [Paenibacillus sp. OAS669]MBE1445775.1 two-component system response regulator ResD [Paenibacillus sp. OAS669]